MRRTEALSLGDAIKVYLKELNIDKKILEAKATDLWHDLMGQAISDATKDIYFNNGKMFISFKSEAARNEVFMMRSEIKTIFNKKLGSDVIADVIVR